MKNTGLNLQLEQEHRKETDWEHGIGTDKQLLGASQITRCIAEILPEARRQYLPAGELQNIGQEKMDCASRSIINILETKFNFLLQNNLLPERQYNFLQEYLTPNGIEFSDAAIAIWSGTTREGNSLIAPCEAVHKHGLVPKKLLPQLDTFEAHHDPKRITPEIERIAKEFNSLFSINYIRVLEKDFKAVREWEMLDGGGFAWPQPTNGFYPRVEYDFNHAFMQIKNDIEAFDNYFDSVDGDYIKQLAPDYKLVDYAYRLVITIKKKSQEQRGIIDWLKWYFWEIMKRISTT